ncbi:peptidoglycan-binding domain-containing protein [Deinococcus frigens]|uniref:peptidoglycan-binding domain-containing protein n=1 Tax=Deinococcus frigens TaxID=249403 RepID=UPI00049576BF|nr:peptidoglycan-binding domain-containing protein [Deinococcus frigens]
MKRAAALAFSLLVATAATAPGRTDLEAAATQSAQMLGGVLRDCPTSFAGIGTPEKQCVGVGNTVEDARLKLSAALPKELYGVWRSRDGQRSVYNWLRTAGGYVYLRLQPDPNGRAQTLIYLDLPPAQSEAGSDASPPNDGTQIGGVTLTPAASAPPKPATPAEAAAPAAPTSAASPSAETPPSPQPSDSTAKPTAPTRKTAPTSDAAVAATPNLAPVPFGRALKLQNRRLNGPDVLAVQNRLIALMRPQRAGQGDGWYGPVTTQTVRAFQQANGLPVTGVVDRKTWERLFSASAQHFDAPRTP